MFLKIILSADVSDDIFCPFYPLKICNNLVIMLFSERTTLRSLYAIGRPSVCLSVGCL